MLYCCTSGSNADHERLEIDMAYDLHIQIERNIVRKKDLAMQNEMAKRNATTSSRVLNPEDKSTVLAETLKKAIVSRQVMVPIEEQVRFRV